MMGDVGMHRPDLSVEGHELRIGRPTSKRGAGRFFCECECGYRSSTRVTETSAMSAGINHVLKLRAELRRNGISVTSLHRSA